MFAKRLAFIVAFVCIAVSAAFSAVPPMISYQGKLMQPSGVPVPDNTYSMQFAIYDVPTGGTALWSETNPAVQVKGGLFAAMLGSVTNLPANIFDSPDRFFGVKVGADPEMTPRQKIASVPFAQVAGNGVPVGGVIMWSGAVNQIPQGWALCDGTNGAPDLRDRFIVGAGAAYAVGASGGTAQVTLTTAQMPTHTHDILRDKSGSYTESRNVPTTGTDWWQHSLIATKPAGGDQPHENRPPYYALCFIMKVGY